MKLLCTRMVFSLTTTALFLSITLDSKADNIIKGTIWANDGIIPDTSVNKLGVVVLPRVTITGTLEGLKYVTDSKNDSMLSIVALAPLWEVVPSVDPALIAINASDGGIVGTWDTFVYERIEGSAPLEIPLSKKIRSLTVNFAHCSNAEDVNVAVVGWSKNGKAALVVAEVPPHSSCQNMGKILGFKIMVKTLKVLQQIPDNLVRNNWRNVLGARLLHKHKL